MNAPGLIRCRMPFLSLAFIRIFNFFERTIRKIKFLIESAKNSIHQTTTPPFSPFFFDFSSIIIIIIIASSSGCLITITIIPTIERRCPLPRRSYLGEGRVRRGARWRPSGVGLKTRSTACRRESGRSRREGRSPVITELAFLDRHLEYASASAATRKYGSSRTRSRRGRNGTGRCSCSRWRLCTFGSISCFRSFLSSTLTLLFWPLCSSFRSRATSRPSSGWRVC
mmetsp:Transcript_25750/g.35972  ORF Transcript_25750/g.35972 Transcript_25750/m.35972 type:complete len:226 (-) Transcript_25750:624-1301(-)